MLAVPERIYYDGECGLCHRLVAFTLRREGKRELFRFAPLQGPTFAADVPSRDRATLPDSFAVRTSDGRLLVRSDATLHVLRRLGGAWRVLAGVLGVLPRAVRDLGYDLVARARASLRAALDGLPAPPAGARAALRSLNPAAPARRGVSARRRRDAALVSTGGPT